MEILAQAIFEAVAVWEQALLQLSWYHGLIVAAYLGAGWLCFLNAHVARSEREKHVLWYLTTAVLCGLGVNIVLHGDVFVTQFVRSLAKLQGWYGDRRTVQNFIVGVVLLGFLFSAKRLFAGFKAAAVSSESVAFGLVVMLILLAMRTVSWHVTDTLLNLRLGGISAGRLVECAAIGVVWHGALRCLRLS
jgi:hypothetical protein